MSSYSLCANHGTVLFKEALRPLGDLEYIQAFLL